MDQLQGIIKGTNGVCENQIRGECEYLVFGLPVVADGIGDEIFLSFDLFKKMGQKCGINRF